MTSTLDPFVLGLREISIRYGRSIHTARLWSSNGTLPAPDAYVSGQVPVWRRGTVDRWAKRRGLEIVNRGPYPSIVSGSGVTR